MFDRIASLLSRVPRWLLVVWALLGPFLGMFLRELLKDRLYSGVNHWLDQTLGPVVSTLASSALWIIWMTFFGAVLLAVWRFSHLQHLLDANEVPQLQPDVPRKPPLRQLSPYEAEQKARLIDKALHTLRSGFPPVINRARSLESQGWNAFKHRNQSTYVDDLKKCRENLASCTGAIAELRRGCPEYDDIAAALQHNDDNPDSAMGDFLVTYQYLSVHLKDGAPSDALENPMGPRRLALRSALDDLARWRSNAERTLVELRRKLTP